MIEENEVFEVARIEHHHLATCPCMICEAERKRRRKHAEMTPDMARAFYGPSISTRPPSGSVARDLVKK